MWAYSHGLGSETADRFPQPNRVVPSEEPHSTLVWEVRHHSIPEEYVDPCARLPQ